MLPLSLVPPPASIEKPKLSPWSAETPVDPAKAAAAV
jgi:hypothetical protein